LVWTNSRAGLRVKQSKVRTSEYITPIRPVATIYVVRFYKELDLKEMYRPIKRVLRFLMDGEFHGIEGISEELGVPIEFVAEVARFLERWSFAEFDEEGRRIRLRLDFIELPQDP